MESPGKGIQHLKTPQQDFTINLLKKCWGILQSVAHVILMPSFITHMILFKNFEHKSQLWLRAFLRIMNYAYS
jgi:hypothetical protein